MKTFTSILRFYVPLKRLLSLILLFVTLSFYGQTVTNVSPTRVTTRTVVTITGESFTSATLSSITLTNVTIDDKKLLDSSTMTFVVTEDNTSDRVGVLTVSSNIEGTLSYVAPASKTLAYNYGVTKITEIYTKLDVNGSSPEFWSSGSNVKPDNSHDLLGYKYNGVVYSTGVDDAMLESNLGLTSSSANYEKQDYRAYSTNGVTGTRYKYNYIATGELVDGNANEGIPITSNNILGLTAYDVITDGVNGLDLGTGITNFNQTSNIRFFSGNGLVGAVDDDIPDLLITQIAQPGDVGSPDVYYYADEEGNVVGRPVLLTIMDDGNGPGATSSALSKWELDLYNMYEGSYATSTPFQKVGDGTRPIRMVALHLSDFGITGDNDTNPATYLASVNNINMMAGGSSDMAFLAYNKSAFEIKAPTAEAILPRYVCRLPSTTDIVFTVTASVEGGFSGDSKETLNYEWLKFNDDLNNSNATLNIDNIDETDIATYKVRVYNDYGAVTVPVELGQGGTPTFWNGSTWNTPPAYTNAGITIADEDRSLIFYDDYNKNVDLEGCDCTVPAGYNVTIPSGKSLTIYDNIIVEGALPAYVEDGVTIPAVPAGTFTLKNNASLVQINDEDDNINLGDITMERSAVVNDISDYIYWSSPVANFNVSNIATSRVYQWDPKATNTQSSTGNWISATNASMLTGEGYSVRVSNANDFMVNFVGKPNNGTISTNVFASAAPIPTNAEDKHWNLLGNPYPSAISADEFLLANTNLDGAISLWTHGTAISNSPSDDPYYADFGYNYSQDDYVVYNAMGSVPEGEFAGYIAAGQAFFVQLDGENNAADGEVEFKNNMREDGGATTYDNSQFFKTSQNTSEEKQLVWLSLVDEKLVSSETLVGYVKGATLGKDRLYDAYSNQEGFNIYSILSDKKLIIQGRPLPFSDVDEVPLGIQLLKNGSYKVGIDNVKGNQFTDSNQAIYLEDTYLGVEHDLRLSPYSFTASKGVTNDRFILKYKSTARLSVDDDLTTNTLVYTNNETLHIKSAKSITGIHVYDISGKQLINYKPTSIDTRSAAAFPFSKGVYIIGVILDNGIVVTKKLIH